MNELLHFIGWGALWTYVLWLAFLAVVSLRRAKEEGTLTLRVKILAYPFVGVAFIIDFLVNTVFVTFLVFELPQWQSKEFLVTDRLKRIRREGKGWWRLAVANWFVPLLNPFDPDHI